MAHITPISVTARHGDADAFVPGDYFTSSAACTSCSWEDDTYGATREDATARAIALGDAHRMDMLRRAIAAERVSY